MKKPIVLFAMMLVLITGSAVKAEKENHNFIVPVLVQKAEAEGSDIQKDASGMLGKLCGILSEKTGDDVQCHVVYKPNEAMSHKEGIEKYISDIEERDFSAVYLSSNDYYNLTETYGYDKLLPVLSISFNKKTEDLACLYIREGDGIDSVEQLRGKKWAGSYFYMGTRYILEKNGVDEPLADFFGEISLDLKDQWVAMAEKLISGETDVFTGSLEDEMVGRIRDKRYKEIKTLVCEPHRATHMIAFNKDKMSINKMKEYRKILLGAHTDKAFGSFQFLFVAIRGHFVPFSNESYEVTKNYMQTCTERGWLKEQMDFVSGK
ncbi:MAG TPA: hypothetical protein PLN69_06800 [bacterium]|nr:hypothetical protein [bacterium]